MPLISEFFGIKIMMFWRDHYPPHFHAEYGDFSCRIDIINSVVLEGMFPSSKLKLLLAWCELHKKELLENWEKARRNEEITRIEPLR